MAGNTRKLHYKHIKDTAAAHVGHKGDIWYDPNTTDLRFYSGDAGGTVLSAGGGPKTFDLQNVGPAGSPQNWSLNLNVDCTWIYTNSQNNIQINVNLPTGTDRVENKIYWIKMQFNGSTNTYFKIDPNDGGASSIDNSASIDVRQSGDGTVLLGLQWFASWNGGPNWIVVSGTYTSNL